MRKMMLMLAVIWINVVLISGCTSSKTKTFGVDMPTMKAIHDDKFGKAKDEALEKPSRVANGAADEAGKADKEFQWLPNPTLTMYVFKHLTPAGHPVPGYSTFFRLYTQHHIAAPGEQAGWE